MVTAIERTLIDKEKVEINGKPAFRLFFYDHATGIIAKVISFIAPEDVVLNRPSEPISEEPEEESVSNIEELQDALQRN